MHTRTILVTGFEPFGKSERNPSAEAAAAFAGECVAGARLETSVLPVDTLRAPLLLVERLRAVRPDAVVCLGEARGRACLSVERVAVNLLDFAEADNAGVRKLNEPIVPGGPAAYFATLPVQGLAAAVRATGVPAELSLSAGSYLCNQIMFVLLHHLATEGLALPAGFIHLPSLPQQVSGAFQARPSMALTTILAGLRAGLQHVVESLN